jgi:hypothetical protein
MLIVIITITFFTLVACAHAFPIPDMDTTSQATQSTSFDTIQSPSWLHAATVPLVCYDVVAMGAFCGLYACGYMVWMKRNNEERERMVEDMHIREVRMRGQRPGRATMIEGNMRRLGMW